MDNSPHAAIPDLVRHYLASHPEVYERVRQEWLNRQDWYRELNQRSLGSGAVPSVMDQRPRSLVDLYGELRRGDDGLWKGGGGVGLNLPLDASSALRLSVGGGGAYGTVQTPIGPQKVKAFFPEAAIGYRREF